MEVLITYSGSKFHSIMEAEDAWGNPRIRTGCRHTVYATKEMLRTWDVYDDYLISIKTAVEKGFSPCKICFKNKDLGYLLPPEGYN